MRVKYCAKKVNLTIFKRYRFKTICLKNSLIINCLANFDEKLLKLLTRINARNYHKKKLKNDLLLKSDGGMSGVRMCMRGAASGIRMHIRTEQ
jgi:hypothetical protein